LVYLILDGFDLGVGILFGTSKKPQTQNAMIGIDRAFLWDGNETWLSSSRLALTPQFPTGYACSTRILYPVLLLLVGLIFEASLSSSASMECPSCGTGFSSARRAHLRSRWRRWAR